MSAVARVRDHPSATDTRPACLFQERSLMPTVSDIPLVSARLPPQAPTTALTSEHAEAPPAALDDALLWSRGAGSWRSAQFLVVR